MAATTYVHSNAFNFLGFVQAGVDPRTGQYSCSIALPELKANHLCGPVFPLKLVFSALNTTDSGFGKGWSLQLSQYDPVSKILSLSTGETFKIEDTTTNPTVPERKLDSFHFAIEPDEKFRVTHKSGLVEVLEVKVGDTVALPSEVHSVEGHKITLLYTQYKGGLALASISDDYGPLLRIDRTSPIMFHVQVFPDRGPGNTPLANFVLDIGTDDWLDDIHLPTDNQASWHFDYLPINGLLCIRELTTPVGGVEKITYASQGHQFPGNTRDPLPRVCTHVREPGFGQPPIKVCYDFSTRNFLGFAAVGLIWTDDGLDNLYQAKSDYEYDSTETLYDGATPVRVTYRKFNNFHLLIEETVTQNDNVNTTRTTYHGIPGATFKQQPAQCQLPKQVSAIWYRKSASSQTHEELTLTTFDTFGNLLEQSNPDGTVETSRYFPAEGGPGCPADPQGFVRTLQDKTITPAPWDNDKPDTDPAPVLRSLYTYALQTGVGGGTTPGWLAMTSETLLQVKDKADPIDQGTELKRTTLTYINKPADRYLHGRKLQDKQTINGKSIITDYTYSTGTNARAGQTVQHTVVTLSSDFDAVQKTFTLQHSLLNGQPLLNRDDQDVEIAYSYDALGRVLTETVAPDTEFEACRSYEYWLSTRAGQQAEQVVTDVSGIKVRSKFDGMNRTIMQESQGADESKPEVFFSTYSAQYDHLGQLESETSHDWLAQPESTTRNDSLALRELELTTHYQYDDWGSVCLTLRADGVSEMSENNPIKQTQRRWLQSADAKPEIMGMVEIKTNVFGKPQWTKMLDAEGQLVSQYNYLYDGLGRCVQEEDALKRVTSFSYDAWSRLLETTLPDQTRVTRAYAPHSSDALSTALSITASDRNESLKIGTQTFDGLDRMTDTKVGPRLSQYLYGPGQMQLQELITPAQQTIHYDYSPGLTDQPTRIWTTNQQTVFTYDPKTALLGATDNSEGRREFVYDLNRNLKNERWIHNGKTWETCYTSSANGRQLSRTDATGLNTAYEYDEQGRVKTMTQGQLKAEFEYSSLGQAYLTRSKDLGTGHVLETEVSYDDHGREVQRTANLSGTGVTPFSQTLTQVWRVDGKLESRNLQSGATTLLSETFGYDTRGRLVLHECVGTTLPRDRQGHAIKRQTFAFDALDNIVSTTSLFEDGSEDQTLYGFDAKDPTQMVSVSHSHADYPASISLDYDADGNLLHDEHAQALVYDSRSRLVGVNAPDSTPLGRYRYDGHDHLVGVQQEQQAETLRFYEGDRLSSTVQGDAKVGYFYDGDRPLGQQAIDDDTQTLLFITDAKQSILGESQQGETRTAVYSAYGERSSDKDLQTLLGFNGEVRDAVSGWYLLGKGYRAYNPTLMRFHSPDNLSPFGAGGVNPYVYCLGDPISYVDPTGHLSKGWSLGLNIAGLVLGVIGTVATGGLVAPALSMQFALFATTTLTGVGAAVTGGIGAYTSDQQASKVLGNISTALGVVSLLSGLAMVKTGTSKWFSRGADNADVVDGAPASASAASSRATTTEAAATQTTTATHSVETQTAIVGTLKPKPTAQIGIQVDLLPPAAVQPAAPTPPVNSKMVAQIEQGHVLRPVTAAKRPAGSRGELEIVLSGIKNGQKVSVSTILAESKYARAQAGSLIGSPPRPEVVSNLRSKGFNIL